MPRRILVTSALPYANGSIHLGHLVDPQFVELDPRRDPGHMIAIISVVDRETVAALMI